MENNTQKIHDLLSTASASYANILTNNTLENDLTKSDGGAGHTQKQAEPRREKVSGLEF